MNKITFSRLIAKLSIIITTGILTLSTQGVYAQEAFIGEIKMFAGNFAPRSYALTDGQLLSIAQNTALFSILGTTYGGDGRTTFALPDLRGRVPMHAGTGPGLTARTLGERGGVESVTLTTAQLPAHNHTASATTSATLHASNSAGTLNSPTGNVLADDGNDRIYSNTAPNVTMSPAAITASTTVTINDTGGNQPHINMQPYTVINFIICLQGIFPSRN